MPAVMHRACSNFRKHHEVKKCRAVEGVPPDCEYSFLLVWCEKRPWWNVPCLDTPDGTLGIDV